MSKTILITGASGFIGGNLISHFSKRNYRIIGLSRTKNVRFEENSMVNYFCADLTKDRLPEKVDVIIHAAGLADDRASWTSLYQNNVIGTQRLFENVKHEKFIHISSSSVYSSNAKSHYENEIINPDNLTFYGKSKFLVDEYFKQKDPSKSQIFILRPRAVYGNNDHTLLPRLLKLKKGQFYFTPGKLEYNISLTHVENLIQAVDLCVQDRLEARRTRIFNVADKDSYLLKDIINSVITKSGKTKIKQIVIPLYWVKKMIHFGEMIGLKLSITSSSLDILCQNNVLNTDQISRELGYEPTQDFNSSIISILEHL